MVRTIFTGGQIFDGTGAGFCPGDVAIEGKRIVDVGIGLDGDVVVDCAAGHSSLACSTATFTSR